MTYISDVNPATPSGQDLVLNGDNEIRALKTDLKNTLGGLNGPVYKDATSSGTGGSTPLDAATMSSWETRIKQLESSVGGGNSEGSTVIPTGSIVIWHGPSNTIPLGWKVCDGTTYQYTDGNGQQQSITTPDLRGRFPMGPDWSTTTQGTTGGLRYTNNEQNRGTEPVSGHTHTTTTAAYALKLTEIPRHNHALFTTQTTQGDAGRAPNFERVAYFGDNVGNNRSYRIQPSTTGSGSGLSWDTGGNPTTTATEPHTHGSTTSSTAGSHNHQFNATQPFVALYFICYIPTS